MRRTSIAITFLLGACAGTAATVVTESMGATTPGEVGVVPLDAAPVRIAPTKKAKIITLARGHNAFLGKLWIDAGGKVPLHKDPTEEYIHILEGGGKMSIDGKEYDLTAGATVYMPANAEVSYENGDAPTTAIQVFAGPEPALKYDKWSPE